MGTIFRTSNLTLTKAKVQTYCECFRSVQLLENLSLTNHDSYYILSVFTARKVFDQKSFATCDFLLQIGTKLFYSKVIFFRKNSLTNILLQKILHRYESLEWGFTAFIF